MATQSGHLMLNRRTLTLGAGDTVVSTGLRQGDRGFSPDPPMDHNGSGPSRIQVIPQPPFRGWVFVDMIGQPEHNPETGEIEVTFRNYMERPVELTVLFWNPHTSICPISVDPYGAPSGPPFFPPDNDGEPPFGNSDSEQPPITINDSEQP